eukprot:m.218185 g.218185  ORF g.218185 m.218185 type:complete len:226 (+) comp17216_c0_seq4:273-950(+)
MTTFLISGLGMSSTLLPAVSNYFRQNEAHRWCSTAAIVGRLAHLTGQGRLGSAWQWLRLSIIPIAQLHQDAVDQFLDDKGYQQRLGDTASFYQLWLLQSTMVGLELGHSLEFRPTLAPWHPWQLPLTALGLTAPVVLAPYLPALHTFECKASLFSVLGLTFGYSLSSGRVTTALAHAVITLPCITLLVLPREECEKRHAPLTVLHIAMTAFVWGYYMSEGSGQYY